MTRQTPEEATLVERWAIETAEDVAARSLAEVIRSTLANAIVERDLPPGWRLSEERLASLLGVSRTPIREALAAIVGADLVHRDRRGTLRVGAVTKQQILDVYAVRGSLEALAASLAAKAAAPRHISHLCELNRVCESATDAEDFERLTRANIDFHEAIAVSTGNNLLITFIRDVHNWIRRIPTTTLSFEGRARTALAEHRAIIAAIDSHDSELAENVAREHMRAAEIIRIQMLGTGLPPDGALGSPADIVAQ